MKTQKQQLKEIGSRLETIRQEFGRTQKEMAVQLGVSPATLSGMENGKSEPSFEIITNLHQKFDVNLLYFLFGKGEMLMEDEVKKSITEQFPEEQADFLADFLHYFKESEIVRLYMMAYFKKFMLKNKKVIEMGFEEAAEENN